MQESEKAYTDTLEFLPGALIEFNIARMAVTYMNRMAIFLFGYDRDEVAQGIPVEEIFASEEEFLRARKLVESFALESYQKQTPYERYEKQALHDFQLRKKDGTLFKGGCQASFIQDEAQVPTGIRIHIRDLTEQREVEKALQASEENYKTLVEYSTDLVFLIDNQGKILSVNKAAAQSLGNEPEGVQGLNIHDIFPEKVADEYKSRLNEVFSSGKSNNYESNRRFGSKTIWINTTLNPVKDKSGGIKAVLGVSRDVTERKLAETKIEESDRLRELLLDVITHDLKTPAGVIYGLAEMAREHHPEDEIVESIFLSSQRLLDVLDNTSVLSRAVFGEPIPKSVLVLHRLISEVGNDFSSQLESAGMSLEIKIPKEITVTANPLIGEAVKNYICNAIKYARDGKKIIVEAIEGKDSILIGVKDHGKTIPAEKRKLIFERGAQLSSSRRKGRGLGLAIVRRIAEAHNGDVGVEPNQPTGNIFYFNIPK